MGMSLISDEEKKKIFSRIEEVERKMGLFVEEAQEKINDVISENNSLNKRIEALEKK